MWKTVKLKNICTVFTDGDWIETKDQSIEGIRLVQTGNVKTGSFADRKDKARYISDETFKRLNCTEVMEGDILVSRLPEPVGRACVIPKLQEKAITAVDCTVIRTKEDVLPNYLNYYMQSPQYFSLVQEKVTGATRQRISRKNLGEVLVSIPPLAEQQRIVAKLDAAFAEIDRAIEATISSREYSHKILTQHLHRTFSSQKDEAYKFVGDVAEHCLGKMLDKKKNKGEVKSYLRNKNVRWFNVETDDLLEMRFETHEHERYAVRRGDLLICEGGYPGRAAIWNDDEEIYIQKAIHRVRFRNPIHNVWLMHYLYYLDVTDKLKQYFTGAGIQHFTGKALAKLPFPYLSDEVVTEQLRTLSVMQQRVEEASQLFDTKLRSLESLKSAILSQELQPPQSEAA